MLARLKMKKSIFIMGCALSSMFLTACNVPKIKKEVASEEKVNVEKDAELIKEQEKQLKISEGLKNYKDGESPLYIDNILLVNKQYSIPKNFANGLNSELLKQFEKMKEDAKKEGLTLSIRSGFRDNKTQEMLFTNYAKRDGEEKANRYSARPGHSEHETGLAIDISNGDTQRSIGDWFTETPQAKWLYENAYKYGFILRYPEGKEHITGYKYESWHYRYVGEEHSKYFNQNNLTLEEYLGIEKDS